MTARVCRPGLRRRPASLLWRRTDAMGAAAIAGVLIAALVVFPLTMRARWIGSAADERARVALDKKFKGDLPMTELTADTPPAALAQAPDPALRARPQPPPPRTPHASPPSPRPCGRQRTSSFRKGQLAVVQAVGSPDPTTLNSQT